MEMPATRQEAIALGEKKYFTGQECKRGHIAPYTVRSGCIECAAERQREWIASNLGHVRERRNAAMREYRKDPAFQARQRKLNRAIHQKRYINDSEYRQRLNARNKARSKRPDVKAQISATNKERWANDPEYRARRTMATMRWFRNPANLEKVKAYTQRQRARHGKIQALLVYLTDDEWQEIVQFENQRREWNKLAKETAWHLDHIVPLAKGGLTVPWNIQLLPSTENIRKKDLVDWAAKTTKAILRKDIRFLRRAKGDSLAQDMLILKKQQLAEALNAA